MLLSNNRYRRFQHRFATPAIVHLRGICASLVLLASIATSASARAEDCTAESAWSRVRKAFPIHDQALARCDNPATGRAVVILTEPPPHIRPDKAEGITKPLFTVPSAKIDSVQ